MSLIDASEEATSAGRLHAQPVSTGAGQEGGSLSLSLYGGWSHTSHAYNNAFIVITANRMATKSASNSVPSQCERWA